MSAASMGQLMVGCWAVLRVERWVVMKELSLVAWRAVQRVARSADKKDCHSVDTKAGLRAGRLVDWMAAQKAVCWAELMVVESVVSRVAKSAAMKES